MTRFPFWYAAVLLAGAACYTPAHAAEELRIGFIAPKTGIYSQLGMATKFQKILMMFGDGGLESLTE